MPRANKINSMFKPAPAVKAGTIKYDNPRQNIDPAIVTQDVTAKNILFNTSNHLRFNGTDLRLTTPTLNIVGDVDIVGGFLEVNGTVINPITVWVHGAVNATVADGNIFQGPADGGRGYSLINLLGGTAGQIVTIIGGAVDITFTQSGNMQLESIGSRVLSEGDTLQLVFDGTSWYQIAYSNNN
jgi:hypothetical protein